MQIAENTAWFVIDWRQIVDIGLQQEKCFKVTWSTWQIINKGINSAIKDIAEQHLIMKLERQTGKELATEQEKGARLTGIDQITYTGTHMISVRNNYGREDCDSRGYGWKHQLRQIQDDEAHAIWKGNKSA